MTAARGTAQLKSLESLTTLQAEAAAVVDCAKAGIENAQAERADALQAREHVHTQLRNERGRRRSASAGARGRCRHQKRTGAADERRSSRA